MTVYVLNAQYSVALNLAVADKLTLGRLGSVQVFDGGAAAGVIGAGGNAVQIDGSVSDSENDKDGILLNGNTNALTISATGFITANRNGLNLQGGAASIAIFGQVLASRKAALLLNGNNNTVAVAASGSLLGGEGGINVVGGENLTLNNAGRIASTGGNAISASGRSATVTNSGVIASAAAGGVYCLNGSLALNNTGAIQVQGYAVNAVDRLVLVNSGVIQGALAVFTLADRGTSIYNSGYILGGLGGVFSYSLTSGDTIINDGFMQGSQGAAAMGGGADLFDGRNGLQFGSILGQDGADALFGGAGNDFLYGGNDNDQLSGGGAGDYLDGGAGADFARYDMGGPVTASLANNAANTGDAAGDTYVSIEGLIGSNAGDLLVGDGGANTLFGLGGQDGIAGGDGNDVLYGGDGDDSLSGQAGNDIIAGGAGGDILAGGLGGDVFLFTGLADAGDLITDFNTGGVRDSFDIRAIFDATGYAGNTPRVGNILQVLQNGADTDVYLYNTFLFRIPNLYAPALDDTYFTFQ